MSTSMPPVMKGPSAPRRHATIWVVGGVIVALLAFMGWRSCRSDDSSTSATTTVVNRDGGTAEKVVAVQENNIYCTDHADDADAFASWYCTEFRPWAKKIEGQYADHKDTKSNTTLKILIGVLIVTQLLTWAALRRKKDKEP